MHPCVAIIKSGKNRGKICGNKGGMQGTDKKWYCGKHNRKFRHMGKHNKTSCVNQLDITPAFDGGVNLRMIKHIYPNQKVAAEKIINVFKNGKHSCILAAQMQSGKTNTAKYAIKLFEKEFDGVASIVLPLNDNSLLDQTRREFGHTFVAENYIIGASDARCINYIKDIIESYAHLDTKLLIIIDESHIGCATDSSICKLLNKAKISMNGTDVPDNVYLLTISATPNAETASLMFDKVAVNKGLVVLYPGEGYYGVHDMIRENKIHASWCLKGDGYDKLLNLCQNYRDNDRYAIIRCHNDHGITKVAELLRGDNIKVVRYDSKSKSCITDINDYVTEKPQEFTVILIARRLTAGYQLNTENICMVYSYDGEVDVTVQGLLGRCCGYGKQTHGVDIYANPKHVQLYSCWAKNGYAIDGTPNTKYVSNGVSNNLSDSWEKNVPIKASVPPHIRQLIEKHGFSRYDHLHEPFKDWFLDTYAWAKNYSSPIKNNGIMILNEKNAETSWYKYWHVNHDAWENKNKRIGFEVSSVTKTSGYYIYVNLLKNELLICYSKKLTRPVAQPKVSKECAYYPGDNSVRIPCKRQLCITIKKPQWLLN